MFRSIALGVFILSACYLSASLPLSSCSSPPSGNDGGNKETGPVADEKPKFQTCTPGEKVNECTGTDACKGERDCSRLRGYSQPGTCHAGFCTVNPIKDAVKTKDGADPDFSCLTTKPELPKGPEKATLWGPVEAFGLDGDTTDLKVEIFLHDAFMKDSNSNPIATYTSDLPKAQEGCAKTCEDRHICFYKQCTKVKDSKGYSIGLIEFKEIPTNTLLVIRTSGAGFVSTVQFNLWIPADKVVDGAYRNRAFVISETTKSLIPATAGISKIADGNGAIAGEIQDCKGTPIQGATVTLNLRAQKLGYFNGDGDQPDPEQNESNRDGTYAALNIKPSSDGKIRAVFAGNVGGKSTLILDFEAKIFPDSISILTVQPWHPGLAKKP